MAEFEDKLNAILSNPALMSQIMSMAGSMGQSQNQPPPPPQSPPTCTQNNPVTGGLNSMPEFDPAAMQGLMRLFRSTQVDQRQQRLLSALEGYLPKDRMEKLTRAMQAAKVAKLAAGALNQGR